MERVVRVRPAGPGATVELATEDRTRAGAVGEGISAAIFRTVTDGADAILDVGPDVEREALGAALGAPDVAGLSGDRLVLRLVGTVGGLPAAVDRVIARFADPRIFVALRPGSTYAPGQWSDRWVVDLLERGFRVFLLDDTAGQWHERRSVAGTGDRPEAFRADVLYAVRAGRCRTVSAVMHAAGTGGAERSHVELAESLIRQGGMVHTVVPEPDGGLAGEALAVGSSVDLVPFLPWWMPFADDVTRPRDDPAHGNWFDESLVVVLAGVGADVIMTQTSVVPQGALAAVALQRPHVWYLREYGDLDHGLVHPGGTSEFARMVAALSDVVVTNSAGVRAHLFGADADAVRVLHPTPRVDALSAAAPRGERPWTVAVIGSLNPGKGQRDAIEAVAMTRTDDVPVRLALVGPASPAKREETIALLDQLGVADLVELRGPFGDRELVYRGIDAVAITSRAEAFGRVPFEATAHGLPVIYANSGGPAEYMTPGVTGLPYEPGDAAGLAQVLRSLRDDPALGIRIAAQARAEFGGPARRAAFDAGVRDLFLPLTGRRPRDGVEIVLGEVLLEAASRLRLARGRLDEAALHLAEATAGLAEAQADLAQLRAENSALEAISGGLRGELSLVVNSRTWRLRNRVVALAKRQGR